uniref:Minor capsid protein L2 n=1 Tax=Bat papillomavirus TaxID=2004707 RepID=A0A2Z2JQ14_9PAPI|nr:L2 [Bat papillomavirus]
MLTRRRRAAAKDLYAHCKVHGNCPSDIKPKFEGYTIADLLLRWGASSVYLGSLGIGTGRSGGGVPLGTPFGGGGGGGGRRSIVTLRPNIPVETLGPELSIPIDIDAIPPIAPSDPSVIDLLDLPTGTGPEITPGARPGGDTHVVVADIHPAPTEPTVNFTTFLDYGGPENPDFSFVESGGRTTKTQYTNPLFEIDVQNTAIAGETSAADTIIILGSGGTIVGRPEEVALFDLTRSGETEFDPTIEEETSFSTSTPTTSRVPKRTGLYSKRYVQVQASAPEVVTRPRETYFLNPAYEGAEAIDPDVSLIFERDQQELAGSLPSELADVESLSKVTYSRSAAGNVRVSRVGRTYSIKTRSGVRIGAQRHLYTDISPIPVWEQIELPTIAETPFESTFVQPLAETNLDLDIINLDEVTEPVSDEQLLDEDIYDIRGTLELSGVEPIFIDEQPVRTTFIIDTVLKPPVFVGTTSEEFLLPTAEEEESYLIPVTEPHDIPYVVIDTKSFDFYLHPSLTRKKRKRKRVFYWFADGGVAPGFK